MASPASGPPTTREAAGVWIEDLPGPEELGLSPQPMVRWLSPSGLSTTSAQLLLSGIFGAYADKREIQAALKEPSGIDLSNRPGLTLDFMADTGDGFNPTYAVARALADPQLAVAESAEELHLPRGQVLVLGGDIAYPAASRDEFQNRFAGPFAAAFPGLEDGQERPLMLSVAGNHDWLDGLTTFLRVFTEGHHIGGWQSGSHGAISRCGCLTIGGSSVRTWHSTTSSTPRRWSSSIAWSTSRSPPARR
jgi:hypothetical protein